MTDLTNLPEDITPEDFFMDALPEVLCEVELPDGLGEERMQFNVIGEGGVEISIGLDDEADLTIEEGQCVSPPMAVTVGRDDFQSLIAGELRDKIKDATGGKVRIGPRELRHAFMPDVMTQKIKALSGDIQLRIEDTDTGDAVVATVTLGGKTPDTANPTATVSIDIPTLLEVASGKQNPQALFMQGRLRIDGDMAIIMSLMTVLQTR
jgi:putative sterol carrier protein